MKEKMEQTYEEKVELIRQKWACLVQIPPELVKVDISLHADWSGDAVLRIVTKEYCERISSISYPADWWQFFKERWFPKWMLAIWPIKYKKWDLNIAYPDFIPRKGLGKSVSVMVGPDYYYVPDVV